MRWVYVPPHEANARARRPTMAGDQTFVLKRFRELVVSII
jgi:hypothetical protein